MRDYVYADESGNFDFSVKSGASRYFILTTVLISDLSVENRLLDLRRDLAWNGIALENGFHATSNTPSVRDSVFDILKEHEFYVAAIILEKRKALPSIRMNADRFYKHAWLFYMRNMASRINADPENQLMVVAATLGNRSERAKHYADIRDVMAQTVRRKEQRLAMWPANSDPCLQVADYCSWAIQRKWERSDMRSYDIIKDKIIMEDDYFKGGDTFYY